MASTSPPPAAEGGPAPGAGLWVRVGGGLELVPGGTRHGPADPDFPPPGGPWRPLLRDGRLVGWAAGRATGQAALVAEAEKSGARIAHERRTQLLGRLDHKLRSSLLLLQESARSAAFGRTEALEALREQADEVARRAAGLATAAVDPGDPARAVVLAAAFRLAVREVDLEAPPDAIVWAPEPSLVEALVRLHDWAGGGAYSATRAGGWWRLDSHGSPRPLPVPELGEPLVRLLVDTHLGGWLEVSPEGVSAYLPGGRPGEAGPAPA